MKYTGLSPRTRLLRWGLFGLAITIATTAINKKDTRGFS